MSIVERRWVKAFVVAVISDLLDYSIGSIPFFGDIIDTGTIAVNYQALGVKPSILSLIELIPGADFLPTYTILTTYAYIRERRQP